MKIIVMIDDHGDGYGGGDDDDKSDDTNKAQPNSDKLWHCLLPVNHPLPSNLPTRLFLMLKVVTLYS